MSETCGNEIFVKISKSFRLDDGSFSELSVNGNDVVIRTITRFGLMLENVKESY